MNFRYILLSRNERDRLIHSFFSEENIIYDFSLTSEEIERINTFRKPYNSIGYALQYLFLKNRGISILNQHELIPLKVIDYVAEQLNKNPQRLDKYWINRTSTYRNLKEICELLGYNKFDFNEEIESELFNIVISTSSKYEMARAFIDTLILRKLILPNISTIEEIISRKIIECDEFIYKRIYYQIKNKSQLDKLLISESNGISIFSRIKGASVNVSSNGVKTLLKLIKEINKYGEIADLSFLSDSKILYFNSEIQKSHMTRINRFTDEYKKYSYLSMFLYFKKKEFMDMAIEVVSEHIHQIKKRSKRKAQEHNAKSQSIYKLEREKTKEMLSKLLNIDTLEAFKQYQDGFIKNFKDELDNSINELDDVDFLVKSYKSIDYLPELLDIIEFDSNTKPELIEFMRNFKNSKTRKNIKIDISCFDSKWQKNIKKHEYSKTIVGITVASTIRDSVRSGDLFVRESKKYNSLDHYLIDNTDIANSNQAFGFLNTLKQSFEIPRKFELDREIEQDEKSNFSDKIYSYMPNISMSEMIYEVHSWNNFLEDFKGYHSDKLEKQKSLVASLLADGHNIGFPKISIASGIDKFVLRRASDYYLNYENIFRAQKTLVNYHHSLNIVKNWGDGKTSSSDGMRVPINSKTIYADYNAHYGNRGGGIYRHVSDQYTPYYVQILEGRDSNHVLDGLLYHDTDLDIYEHSTDTAGYTEQMFALTYLLEFNFKPRIKNLTQQQLYAFESFETKGIKVKRINQKIILDNYSEVMRLVESIRCGKVKASLILQKINSYNRDNGVAKGLKEIGRIIKTKYIIDYYSDGDLRKEVQKILNKGESINSVARIIFFGKQGRLNVNKIERQLEKVSCLNILLSVLIIWNSRYLEKVYDLVKNEPWFDEDEFKRVSPLGTSHVNFLGRYILEDTIISTKDGLRDLEIKDQEL